MVRGDDKITTGDLLFKLTCYFHSENLDVTQGHLFKRHLKILR